MKQSSPEAQPAVALPVGSQGCEQRRASVLVAPQRTPILQAEPEPQSASALQNCRQVLIAQVSDWEPKHSVPGTQSDKAVQDSPTLFWPAGKHTDCGRDFKSHITAQVWSAPQVVADAMGVQVGLTYTVE